MRTRPLCLLFLAALASVSLILYLFPDHAPDPYGGLDRTTVSLRGNVRRKELRQSNQGEAVTLLYLEPEKRAGELIAVYLAAGQEQPLTGQDVVVKGRMSCFPAQTNPGMFDLRAYYAMRGIVCRMNDARLISVSGGAGAYREGLYRLRAAFAARLDAVFAEEDAALLKAMLLGDSSALDAEVKRLYRMSGILHLLCVSGIHCALVGTALLRLLRRLRLPRFLTAPLCCFFVYSYGLMCGMGVSALRAVAMFALKLLAERLGRSYDMLSAMSLVGLLLLAEEPRYAHDSGFLMSFCTIAALGLMLPSLFPRAAEREERARLLRLAKQRQRRVHGAVPGWRQGFAIGEVLREKAFSGVRAGISILLFTLPVQMCCFYVVPLSGLLLNLLLVPMMSVLMPSGMAVMLLAGLLPPAAQLMSLVPRLIFALTRVLAGTLASLPHMTWYAGAPAARQVIAYYVLLTVFLLRGNAARKAAYLLPVIALALLSFRGTPSLQLTMLDVGQGDAFVLRQGDVTLLIDGGSSTVSGVGTYRLLPYLQHEGIRRLDAVFVSHDDQDHISGILELLEDTAAGGVEIGHVYLPDIGRDTPDDDGYDTLCALAQQRGIPVSCLHAGQQLHAGELTLRCLGPSAGGRAVASGDANAHSMILHLEYGAFSALFTGDVEGEGLTELNDLLATLPAELRTVDVLKVAHHGSRFTTDERFLSLIDARLALISCGKNNRYDHPHGEVLTRLAADGARILTTSAGGAITVTASPAGLAGVESFLP
ncbi:MAG: DNA internalization-related competence protein ComEC/Rec2 [Lachnospiraceae bacterium]|nr:DNA internalization-related competence protein ComEC/Rec2 [Lachnospiraceae bacterium]